MIVAVKRKDYKRILIKAISFVSVIAMFTAYYFHMSEEFSSEPDAKKTNIDIKVSSKNKKAKIIEKIIYREAETAVDLVGQSNVQEIKIVGKRLLMVCDTNSDLEPLMVRYGVMALVKNGINDIKIAISLDFIVESKYDEV